MSNITIIGGTGFAGQAIVQEAVKRGHTVSVLSRTTPSSPINDVTYIQGSITDTDVRQQMLQNADCIVAAAAPRGNMAGKLKPSYLALAQEAANTNTRLLYIGGFSSLRPAAGQPRFFETGDMPAEYKAEATELATTFDKLATSAPTETDWLFISPAATFGAWANIDDTGTYKTGGDVAQFDEAGDSKISANDFALAVVDEIEQPKHYKENVSFIA